VSRKAEWQNPLAATEHKKSNMKDPVYKLIELTGTSTASIEDAVDKAIQRAHKTVQEPVLVPSGRNARQHRQGKGVSLAGDHQSRLHRGRLSEGGPLAHMNTTRYSRV